MIPDDGQAPPEVQVFFDGARDLLTWCSYFTRTAAYAPNMARWWVPMIAAIQRGGQEANLDPRLKELAVLKTSTLNQCAFCTGHNIKLGRLASLTTEEIEAASGDDWESCPTLDEREKAAIMWADRVTRNLTDTDAEARKRVEALFTEDELVELTLVSCLFAMLNRFNDSLWLDLDDEGAPPGANLYIGTDAFRRYAERMYAGT
jgi:AhpD family alkylhydroperoxidase